MRAGRSIRSGCVGALLLAASVACGCGQSPGSQPPADGVLTVDIQPAPVSVSGLVLSSAHMQLENVTVIGDSSNGRLGEVSLDLLAAARMFTLDMLPQGVYSRVTFRVDSWEAQGTWRGVPLQIQLESGDGSTTANVDLRSSSGVELSAGHDVTLTVTVDAGSWFAGDLLDSATQSSSGIVIDGVTNNPSVGATLASRVAASFALQDSPIP